MTLRKNVGPENFSKIFLKITHSYTHTHKNKKTTENMVEKRSKRKRCKKGTCMVLLSVKK